PAAPPTVARTERLHEPGTPLLDQSKTFVESAKDPRLLQLGAAPTPSFGRGATFSAIAAGTKETAAKPAPAGRAVTLSIGGTIAAQRPAPSPLQSNGRPPPAVLNFAGG